ncbi:MAG: thiamine-phosphate kinase [Dehalococcoidia bacterium]|nr:thiamine-phosphate kinase [Dehalococcoidia bacterium]
MKVSDLGEFGLIARLAAALGDNAPPELILGIGDDAAVWRFTGGCLLATTDTMVEGVHFLPAAAPWADIGWKALAVNISDVAAMGGTPLFALVTLALPTDTPVAAIDQLYAGLRECAREYAVAIAGGDVVQAPQVAVTVALLGRAGEREGRPLLLRRDAARPGDAIAVTGTLGDAAAALRRLREGAPPDGPLARAHLRPRPPLGVGQRAAALGIVCAIDVSDGLLQDIGHICERSGLGADICAPNVPLSPALREAYPDDALALACSGGEDYQLVLAGPAERIQQLRAQSDTPVTIIGEMRESESRAPRLLDEAGGAIHLPALGWDQLRRP